eukprot:CAMPEP_0117005250 /NCGR_PEP_ID=MMETSP0472-20121206/5939_1 /TAXON_ID=693140 ORGANISM="Tiarina fusus, Strain LIS" /NCGR_SAMPLE_ID=MMETSP0472 /ASSEMBLY_ACC=CAM_ASM_000603 /LENGTH=182 /DNA_ID=CAMNT_0004706449 /DNA_START=34 /DNA_END=582 /DNA_ORIENTATION=+
MHLPLQIILPKEESPSASSFKKVFMSKKDQTVKPAKTSTPEQPGPKKVNFSKRVKVKKIRSHKHYSEDERDAIWHSPEEYTILKQRCLETLKKMRSADFKDSDQFSSRGLEVRTKAASVARKEKKAFAWRAVLDEQEHQCHVGMVDQESIREAYLDISRASSETAFSFGKSDEMAVKEYMER